MLINIYEQDKFELSIKKSFITSSPVLCLYQVLLKDKTDYLSVMLANSKDHLNMIEKSVTGTVNHKSNKNVLFT